VAQLEAQATCNRQVVGSSPTTGSDKLPVQQLIAVSANTQMVPLSQQSSQQLEAEALPGSMREKRSGVWELRVFIGRDGAGRVRHRSVTFHGTKKAAGRDLARLIADNDWNANLLEPAPAEWGPLTTINQAIEGWKRNGWQDLSPNTVRGYQGVWDRHVRDSIGGRRIATVSPYELEQFYRELKAAGCGQTTVRLARALLHRSCRLARKWSGNRLPNPVADTELPSWSVGEQGDVVRAPEAEEILALLDAARRDDPRVAGLIRVIAATGMRRGEACGLRWEDVNNENATIRIDEGVVQASGTAVVRSPKTRASIRSVAVDADTLALLRELQQLQQELAEACGLALASRSFVFSFEPGGDVPPHPDTMSHAFARVRTRAGVAADLHLHSLRHFQATTLDPVISEAQKQSRLGWSTVRMARHYTDSVPAEDRRAADHVGRVLSGSSAGPDRPHLGHGAPAAAAAGGV
jgi:integrase